MLHSLQRHLLDLSAISVDAFRVLVDQIRARGLRIGTLAEAITDSEVVAITFDDGYDDIMQILPYLMEEQIPVTIFVPTAFIGKENIWDNFVTRSKRRHLSESDIRQLAAKGVQFGSHTHSHCDLTMLSDQNIETELATSKAILESLTGHTVAYLAYPFGRCNKRVVATAERLGYQHGFTSFPHAADAFNVGRVALNKLDSAMTIKAKLHPGILSGAEYLKSFVISRFSHLTPIYLRFSSLLINR